MKKSVVPAASSARKYILFAAIAVCLLYLLDILFFYFSFDADRMFGYLDYQSHWQSLYDLMDGKVLYRDFYWEYGYLTLLLRLPFFLLFGRTFFGLFFSNFIFLPLLGIGLSYAIAKQYLNKKSLILFMFMMLLYRANNDYNAIRHLIPELGLITASLGILQQNSRKKLIGSFLLGISLISSAEYALIGNLAFVIFFILHLFMDERKNIIKNFLQTFLFQIGIGSLFFLYLFKNNLVGSYVAFHSGFVKAFYTNSPCREVFPRFSDFVTTFQNDNGFLFNFFVLLQRFNIYAVVGIIIFLLVWTIRNRHSKWLTLNITLIFYTILAYTRTLNTPCYLNYGITYTALLTSLLLFIRTSKRVRYITFAIIIWLCLASGFQHTVKKMFNSNSTQPISQEKEYLPVAGMSLSKPLVAEYNAVTGYVKNNTDTADYVYVYPDGPYRQLTGRKSPTAVYSTVYYGLIPSLAEKTFVELSTRKPKYVIINTYNSSSFISAVNGVNYNVFSEGSNVFIEGLTTKVEDYIQQNYEIVKKYKIAWILKRRSSPVALQKVFTSIAEQKKWTIQSKDLEQESSTIDSLDIHLKVVGGQPTIYFITDNFADINMLKIPVKVDLGLIKSVSKFSYEVYVIASDGQSYLIKNNFITSDWQEIIVYIPKVDAPLAIKAVAVKVSENLGFLLWGIPNSIHLKKPIAYTINSTLKIDDSIIK